MDRHETKVELFTAVTVDEMLERGANIQSRGDWEECSASGIKV